MQDSQSLEQAKSFFLSGLEKLNGDDFAGAEIDFQSSLKFAPDRLSTLINLSIVLIKLNKYGDAEQLMNEGLLSHPKDKELLMGLVQIYEKLISLKPDYAEAHANLGNSYKELNMHEEALAAYNTAIILNPNLTEVYSSRGNLLQDLNQYQEALEDYDKAITLKPDNSEAYLNRGNVLNELSRYEEAIESQNKAIELDPSYAKAYYNCGVNLGELKRYEQALTNYENAIDINPDYAEAYSNRGNILKELMRHDEALSSYDQAILIKPDYAEAYFNRGVVFGELKQIKRAINNYEKSISLNPYYAEAYLNKAVLQLTENINDGWILYKWRWDIKAEYSERFNTKIPNWDGQTDSKSIKILFWGEQGIGDEIFYFGMLKNFTKISARITVAADNRLHSLFKRSMPEAEFIDRKKIDTECNENSFDYQAPIGDIGLLCSVDPLIDLKLPKPFLLINKFRYSNFKNKKHIFKNKIVCGLSWKSANKKIGLSKSLDLIDLSPLLLIENVEFVSLQYGSTKDEINFVENKIGKKIHTVDDLDIYNDIDGLVSLIYDCDFVVTTSNITAHLTGAIGKKGIVLLPFSKGKIWYWHSGEGQSAWYPSLELTSQIKMNDWKEPINKCKEWVLDQL